MFDVNGKLYGIRLFGNIYRLIRNDENKINPTKEVSFAHKFFNLNYFSYFPIDERQSVVQLFRHF
jgi:hypothetical protein